MIRAFVILSSKGFPIFEQYYSENSINSDQAIIDNLAETPKGHLSQNENVFDLVDEMSQKIQVRTIPLDESKWLVLISSDPEQDYLKYHLKDLKLAGIMVATGDAYAIEHVVSGFVHPLN